MTLDKRRKIIEAVYAANMEAARFQLLIDRGANLETLYHAAKPVHEAALGIWTTIVSILREQQGAPNVSHETDAINLEELFSATENADG